MIPPTRPTSKPARRVASRATNRPWAMATAAALGLAVPLVPALVVAPAAYASEGGESGESGVVRQEGTAGFLTDLGLFEAAHRIVGTLYQRGDYAQALAQLQDSHHAYYDDLLPTLTAINAPGFDAETATFAEAVAQESSTEIVAARLDTLFAAIETARAAAHPTVSERLLSMKTLLDVAAADYAGGVENGEVTFDHEYRDAWGFVETVRARAQALTLDPATAQAGTEVLAQLAPLAPLFPDLTATQTSGDPSLLSVAAAWVEIIALRNR